MECISLLVDRLISARHWTESLLADIDTDHWFKPPGQNLGHVAWQLGHLAASQIALVHVRCFDRTFENSAPAGYIKLFGRGSTPVADSAAYPALKEIRRFFDDTQKQCLELIRAMPPTELDKPTAGDPHPMFSHKAGALAMASMHEAFHAGQIALIRRLWGKAPLR